ncbi:MAG: universal stress protein [bacterium]
MKRIMVAFSATTIHYEVAQFAIQKAKEENAELVLLSIRDQNVSKKVSRMLGDTSFLGQTVIEKLQKQIKEERGQLIMRELRKIKQEAEKQGIHTEIATIKGAFADNIFSIAEARNISTLIIEKKFKKPDIETPFEIITIKES